MAGPREDPSPRWSRVTDLVGAALDRPPHERTAWLVSACAGDDALYLEATSLLAADAAAEADGFLHLVALDRDGAAESVAAAARESVGLPSGQRIGPYEIVRELGHGGMGVVYLAARVDQVFDQLVAVKILPRLSTDWAHRRFDEERRILAALGHPNIARLLDGGTTTDGLSYFVMEYVDGVPLDAYCDAHRLNLLERVVLTRQVLSAVGYAHRRLVIHRDIKCRNVLVTSDGIPKLLDFGIARLLGADGQTLAAQRAFTLENASPEQIRGEPMAVTSDVYALGVLMYHLLTGQRPCGHTSTSDTTLMRAICDEPPTRPSAAARSGTGFVVSQELEWILLKALRKEPERRYESVEEFDADLGRWLTGRPVLAAPDSRTYRIRKFVTRHRAVVAASVLLAASLVAGMTATLWQARRADRRFNDVRRLANTFIFDVHDAVATLPGSTAARKLLVSTALTYLDSLSAEAAGDPSLLRELATSYDKLADVLGRPNSPNLGDLPGALAAYRTAQAARDRVLAAGAADADLRWDRVATSSKMARVMHHIGQLDAALAEASAATALAVELAGRDTAAEAKLQLAASYTTEGFLLGAASASAESIDRLRRAVALLEPLQAEPGDRFKLQLAQSYSDLGQVLCAGAPSPGLTPDPKGCVDMIQRSNAIEEPIARANPSDLRLQRAAFAGAVQLGEGLAALGETSAAIEYFRRACTAGERLAAIDVADRLAQSDFAIACERLGTALATTGGGVEAMALLQRAARIQAEVLAADPANLGTRARLAEANAGLGYAHAALGAATDLSRAARVRHWHEAKARFNDGLTFWVEMQERGLATGGERDSPEGLRRQIAACDAALVRLQ
jgi:eukaryotic-like serine/threonine-protein kinase